MSKIIKEQKGSVLVVKIIGSIDETINFDQLIGSPQPEMEINCKEVARINSVGVKAWIKYFQTCQSNGSKIRYVECSIAIVEQINLISNFICGGIVESIYVPFSCFNCKNELIGLFNTSDLKKSQFKLPDMKCIQCGNKIVFDDIQEEYFGFLMR